MLILPAIDIMNGKPVRLYKGDYGKVEVVAQDVIETARKFEQCKAEYIHFVDLDAAKSGNGDNHDLVIKAANKINIPVEFGGGIRSYETIKYLLSNGIQRVILGTSAIEDEELLKKSIYKYGDRIAVSIDCKNGRVCGKGWIEESKLDYIEFAKKMESLGVEDIIVTDIGRDGTLQGPNLNMLSEIKKNVNINITASGGIHDIEDVKELNKLNIYGMIIGKAIYAGKLSLSEAIEISRNSSQK